MLNGEHLELEAGVTVAAMLARLQLDPRGRGIAVAVDGEVVPRGTWEVFQLADDARVEVLGAMQGG